MKTQMELREFYRGELDKVWKGNEKMINHCLKDAAYLVPIANGVFPIKKPHIEKNFCFGYHTHDDEGYDMANYNVERTYADKELFIKRNLREIKRTIKSLTSFDTWAFQKNYHTVDSQIYSIFQPWDDEKFTLLSTEDKNNIIEGYNIVLEDFKKRLNTYLKRYGLSKIRAWAYWADA